jgi:thiamine biosynthesis lipoprotein
LLKSNLNKKAPRLLAAALALRAAPRAGAAGGSSSRMRELMGTFCQIEAWGSRPDDAVTAAFDEIDRWDRVLSLYKKESELNALNASGGRPFRASPALFAATKAALSLAQATGGAFDPTVLPVIRSGPAALPLVGWEKVRLDSAASTIEFTAPGMALDFGGVGKGWALDRAAEVLAAHGVARAFINFGGQILAIGKPEGGYAWSVVVPGLAAPLRVRDESVSTSGDEQRPGHIVSPFDGRPVRRRLNATAVLGSATEADAWSTALYVLGAAPPGFPGRAYFTDATSASVKGTPQ